MKILHVTPVYPPSIGGVERYVSELVNEQQILGNDVYVMTSDFPMSNCTHSDNGKTIRLPVLYRPRGKWGYTLVCPTIFGSLGRIETDVIHAHTPPKLFAESTGLYKSLRREKKPLILTYHIHNESLISIAKSLWQVYNFTVGRWFFSTVSKIIVLTYTYKALINQVFGVDVEKIAVVPPGVDDRRFDPRKYRAGNIRIRYGIFEENVIVFIGRLVPMKGIDNLIKALPIVKNELHDTSLLIIGDGPLRSDLEILSRELNVDSSVRFLGRISDEDLPQVLSLANLLVLPSIAEGFGLVLLEAMSMEKPVVATRVGGIPDVVIDGKTGILVEKRDIGQLASAIVKVLSDKKLAANMGHRGRRLVLEKYRWSVVTRKILDLYKNAN